jgi:hypothetical protein
MSSVLNTYFSARTTPTNPGFIVASFTNTDGFSQPFPWRYNKQNQSLDLEFVDGFDATTTIFDDEMFFRGQQFGALKLVQRLGANFVTWCETNTDILADAGTVQIHERPIVVTANMVAPNQNPNNAETQEVTYPISFEDSAGTSTGKYCKTLIFMKPLVITYLRSGTRYYRWISQNFEGNS